MTVWLETESKTRADEAFAMVVDAFEQAEQRMSRFRPDSELSWLNTQTDRWAELSPPMWRVLITALEVAHETGGLFDPTLHNALVAAGYDTSFDHLHTASAPSSPSRPQRGNWQSIAVDPDDRAVLLPHDIKLDLGGIGKGFTAQTVIRWLSEWGACLIDAGGDLTAGHAPQGLPGWPVGIGAPWTRDQPQQKNLMRLWLANGSLATSGIDYRKWERGDATAHHIIDPRTGHSAATDLLTCSILAADACRAEAWATATLVAGMARGYERLFAQHMAAALIDHDSAIRLTPHMRHLAQIEQSANLNFI